jgi:hypothetical protein
VPRKEVERRIALLSREKPRNTAMRFRFQTLLQKYTTYQTYWRRVSRQIEEGTYRRDVMKARARISADRDQIARERERTRSGSFDIDIDVELDSGAVDVEVEEESTSQHPAAAGKHARREQSTPPAPMARPTATEAPKPDGSIARSMPRAFALPKVPSPTAPGRLAMPAPPKPRTDGANATRPEPTAPAPAAARAAAPPVAPRVAPAAAPRPAPAPASRAVNAHAPTPAVGSPRLGDSDLRRVYERYIDARRRNNERTDNVPFETVALNIRKMLPHLEEKHAGKRIDFEVVVKDGKVGLKPVPR